MSETRSVVVERMLPHTAEKVWRALTESSLLTEWLMRNDFEPTVGRAFQFRAEPVAQWNGIVESKVLSMEPGKMMSLQWDSAGLASTVTFTLTPVADGTSLRMEQVGFRVDQEFAFKGATYGWQRHFNRLEEFLAGGEA